MMRTEQCIFLCIVVAASFAAGLIGVFTVQWLIPYSTPNLSTVTGVIRYIEPNEGTFIIENSKENFALTVHVTPDTTLLSRRTRIEHGVVVGFDDTSLSRIESLIPGSQTQVTFNPYGNTGTLKAVRVIIGDILPGI